MESTFDDQNRRDKQDIGVNIAGKAMYTRFIARMLFSVVGSGHLEAIKCHPLPTLEIPDLRTTLIGITLKTDRVIEGTASKDSEPLQFAKVEIYSGDDVPRRSEMRYFGAP